MYILSVVYTYILSGSASMQCDEKKMHLLSRCMACRKHSSEHTGGISKEELRLCVSVFIWYELAEEYCSIYGLLSALHDAAYYVRTYSCFCLEDTVYCHARV